MFAIRSLLLSLAFAALPTVVFGQALFVKPIKALGDPHFIATASNPLAFASSGPNLVEGRELNSPQGVAVDTSSGGPYIYIADSGNNRVLGFRYATQLTAGAKADLVLGQPDLFTTNAGGPGTGFSARLSSPTGIVVDGSGNLYVSDTGNNRILRYPQPFAQLGGGVQTQEQYPDMVIGQPNLSTATANPTGIKQNSLQLNNGTYLGRTGLAIDAGGNLWASDIGNNRVLRFPAFALKNGNNPNADVVIGQQDFISASTPTTRQDKTTLVRPSGLGFDAAGRLYVGDAGNRVLVYPIGATSNTAAIRILGIPPSSTSPVSDISFGTSPTGLVQFGITKIGPGIGITDSQNNRVLIYDDAGNYPPESTQFSPAAKSVLGQASFGDSKSNRGNPEASNSSFNAPSDILVAGSELFTVDASNNRVLVFSASGGLQVNALAARVIGQLDFAFSAPNLIEGHEFNFGANNGYFGSVAIDNSVVPARLYVADTFNHRVLGFSNFAALKNGAFPDVVLGQPDLKRNLINYPANDANKPNSVGLYLPTGLAVDLAGNVYVADSGNSRVLRFPAPFAGVKAGPAADLVIGQANFTSTVTDNSPRTLRKPVSIALTSQAADPTVAGQGFLIVSDASQNRVLFFPKPFSSGMNASVVLGQNTFSDSTPGTALNQFSTPRGVAVDQFDRVLVVDSGNGRISCFDRAFSLSNGQAAFFGVPAGSGTSSTASGLTAISASTTGDFWVANSSTSSLTHFPSIDNLPGKNFASDASLPSDGPISVFVDKYKNVVVGDSINRVLYFVPQVDVENAANYSQRPLSPGAIAAVFPTVKTNTLTSGTQSFDSLPNPLPVATALADTQVLVNGTPTPVFYVSPTQINVPLSYNLPSSGTFDLQIARLSTGQITGAAEVALAAASPALFTIGAAGYGQAIAVHAVDQSLNSPTNPITRGQIITLYATGEGPVPGAPADGNISTTAIPNPALPIITLNNGSTQFTIPSSNISYSGIAPYLVGVWQINVTIPPEAPSGTNVQIILTQYGIPSVDPANQGTTRTNISIK